MLKKFFEFENDQLKIDVYTNYYNNASSVRIHDTTTGEGVTMSPSMFNKLEKRIADSIHETIDVASLYPRALFCHTDNIANYCKEDVKMVQDLYNGNNKFKIKKVVFNDPATIVFWEDGTKTVVKTQDGDVFDPEKGLAMAISKKALGNTGRYYNEIRKHIAKYYTGDADPEFINLFVDFVKCLGEGFANGVEDGLKSTTKKED